MVICCDGTWNEPEKLGGKRVIPTNVLKLVRSIVSRDETTGIEQVVFYDRGIGTESKLKRVIAGATGWGISQNIRDCYRFIANNYSSGDEIYCFGFSRGAYTARSLVGMLNAVGLLDKTHMEHLPAVYAYYRTPVEHRSQSKYHDLVQGLDRRTDLSIKFMGVWDTVGALGVPTPLLSVLSKKYWVGFHDTDLGDCVQSAYQALAIDERRHPYRPSNWTACSANSKLEQVWFAGSHSNVGGGYKDRGLSDIAFLWIINRARECGLQFNEAYLNNNEKVEPRSDGVLINSFSAIYKLLGAIKPLKMPEYLRPIGERKCAEQNLSPTINEMLHESVVERLQALAHYRPKNLLGEGVSPESQISKDGDHDIFSIFGENIRIYRERRSTRGATLGETGILIVDGQQECSCEIIDYSRSGGAKIRSSVPVVTGSSAILESAHVGRQRVTVVWSNDHESGVQFAA